MNQETIELLAIVGSIASIIGLFLGFAICKIKYKKNEQKNSSTSFFHLGSTNQNNSKQ